MAERFYVAAKVDLRTSQFEGGDMLRMVGFTLASILAVAAITWVLGRLLHLERKMISLALLWQCIDLSVEIVIIHSLVVQSIMIIRPAVITKQVL